LQEANEREGRSGILALVFLLLAALAPQDLVFLGVPVLIGVGIWRVQRQREAAAPLRNQVMAQPITFRCPVAVKYRHQLGWSTKVLRGMEIVVRDSSVQISTTRPSIGAALGSEWYFEAADTSIEVSDAPSDLTKREWIVIQASEPKAVRLALSATNGSNSQVWDALLVGGARGFGSPPQH
jgi:hypothetical protein